MTDMTNGRLGFENIIMFSLGSSSLNAIFILLRSRNLKMASGSGSKESTLEELA